MWLSLLRRLTTKNTLQNVLFVTSAYLLTYHSKNSGAVYWGHKVSVP